MSPEIRTDEEAWLDLRTYDQSWFDRGRSNPIILLWWLVQGILFPLSLHQMDSFRCAILRLFGAKIGLGVKIRPTVRVTYPWKVAIGDYTWIGDDVVIYSLDNVTIGSHCVISQKCYLCTGSHDPGDRSFRLKTTPILIGNGTWIAADCFLAAGVKIGSNVVIGARSSVFADIPAQKVAWGSPCRPQYDRKMNSYSS